MKKLVILGIDPGYAILGYGLISYKNCKFTPLGYGSILTQSNTPFEDRLKIIYDNLSEIFTKIKPDAMSIEKLYFQNNQKTALSVSEARGVILLCARNFNVPIYEYTPLQVKTAVTGYGKATKLQVMEMTKRLLNLQKTPKFDDTTDALAIAICHIQARGSAFRHKSYDKRSYLK